ncbi:acetyl-CoA C-acyltransferase [Pontibacillus yanchengensis]|uniref:Acetyl-CoA C-acyltransferase n=2 Tax=Pontibacillus yanchengensis TaxID=462910 RepID=A0ACC7VC75_9BACI|nr:thiolase family protein [Pontibacillus yanchengensis]MYL35127.1 acetyl-CoA C-acyltransferase [Pontibacillus yanchengensis]MYL52506.1 acetyl-CoA C-acyltransferase [Pontibacillus yanchengensis]
MNNAVIVSVKRTAIGKMGGALAHLRPEQLVSPLVQSIISETNLDPVMIHDVVLGNVVGPGGNIARLSALQAGLPISVPGVTVDRQCGSGLEAINLASRLVQAGAGDMYIAGGVESTSRAPWKVEKPFSLFDPNGPTFYGRARFSPEEIGDPEMGEAAENVASAYNVSREDQDAYAYQSHQKALNAQQENVFKSEIVPVDGVDMDECPRPNTSLSKLARLPSVFRENGTVTAGNACPLNDGAAVVLIMSEEKCKSLGLTPLAKFIDATSAGVDPNYLGIGPVPAVRKLLEQQDCGVETIDVVEFNEAFASQALASLRELHIPLHKVNLSGGALALGHPYGASGAILITRLVTEMKRRHLHTGLATLGIGGGLGLATMLENVEEE